MKPARCPYCEEPVDKCRPYDIELPPDEREQAALVPISGEELSDDPMFDIIELSVMYPCGHQFRREHLRDAYNGRMTRNDLGASVVNPGLHNKEW